MELQSVQHLPRDAVVGQHRLDVALGDSSHLKGNEHFSEIELGRPDHQEVLVGGEGYRVQVALSVCAHHVRRGAEAQVGGCLRGRRREVVAKNHAHLLLGFWVCGGDNRVGAVEEIQPAGGGGTCGELHHVPARPRHHLVDVGLVEVWV